MKVEYEIHPKQKARLDEIVGEMNRRYPPNADFETAREQTKHYFVGDRYIRPSDYDFNAYPDYEIPEREKVYAYVLYKGMHYSFDAEKFYQRMCDEKWKTKNGDRARRWTRLVDTAIERGYFQGKTPMEYRTEEELPITLIRNRERKKNDFCGDDSRNK